MEFINPLTIYLAMTMDGLKVLLCLIGLGYAIAAFVATLSSLNESGTEKEYAIGQRKKHGVRALIWLALSVLLPGTSTVAAMVILPALANNTALHGEAAELYDIFKNELKNRITEEAKED